MEPSTALSVSAQVAVAIAGFAGVVAVFRSGSCHRNSAQPDRRTLLGISDGAFQS